MVWDFRFRRSQLRIVLPAQSLAGKHTSMTFRLPPFLAMLVMLSSPAVCLAAQTATPPEKQTLYYIPHTHWEGAVFKTREEYLEMGLPHILTAIRLLKEHPDYRFVLDQVAYFKPFLERYPEEAGPFRKFVADGRLQLVGGLDIMPDDN